MVLHDVEALVDKQQMMQTIGLTIIIFLLFMSRVSPSGKLTTDGVFVELDALEYPICLGATAWSKIKEFERLKSECEISSSFDDIDRVDGGIDSCASTGTVWETERGKIMIGPEIGSGVTATTFATNDENIVVKVSNEESLCQERASLKVLDGLNGFAPRMIPLTHSSSSIRMSKDCLDRLIVMEKAGDIDWADSLIKSSTLNSEQYMHLSRAIDAMKELHGLGFVHLDLHGHNFRLKEGDSSFLKIIDFGEMEPLIHQSSVDGDENSDDDEAVPKVDYKLPFSDWGIFIMEGNIPFLFSEALRDEINILRYLPCST